MNGLVSRGVEEFVKSRVIAGNGRVGEGQQLDLLSECRSTSGYRQSVQSIVGIAQCNYRANFFECI